MKNLKKIMTIIITGILIISSSALTSFADVFSEATPIEFETTYKGIATYYTETDYGDMYKFTLPKDGYVDFNFKRNPNGMYYYYIRNEGKCEISEGGSPKVKNIQTDRKGLPAGTYYIEIFDYDNKNLEYEFSVKPTYTDYWEKEHNSTFAKANVISLNKNYKGNGMNADYYKFTLKKDGYIDVKFKEHPSKKYKAQLYFNNRHSYASYNIPSGKGVYSKRVGLPAGTYYLKILGYGDEEYEFSVNAKYTPYWEKEFNDSYKTANKITLNKMYNGISDGRSYPYDFYTFNVKHTKTYSIKFKQNKKVSFKYKLLDKKGKCISLVNTAKGNKKDTLNVKLKPGKYYIKVEKHSHKEPNKQYSFGVFS